MKNKAGFKVGDKVGYLVPRAGGLESLRGLKGTVKFVNDIGAEVEFKTDKGVKTYALANREMIKMNNASIISKPTTPREKANDKDNVWAISIQPAPFDRERTVADLIVNGRIVDTVSVSRWHDEDEYDVGVAAYEVVKKLFNIKDKTAEETENTTTKESEWFNGKVVCIEPSMSFKAGKIYNVIDGRLTSEDGIIFRYFVDVNDINNRMGSQFIEVVE